MLDPHRHEVNKWIKTSSHSRPRSTEEMIQSFHSQLRRLEKRLKICSEEQHSTGCLCPWAVDNAEEEHEGAGHRNKPTNLQRREPRKLQMQEYMRAARASYVRGEVINVSPPDTGSNVASRKSNFPPPAPPSPDSDPSPLWDTVHRTLRGEITKSSYFGEISHLRVSSRPSSSRPESQPPPQSPTKVAPRVITGKSPTKIISEIYKSKLRSPSKKSPFITAVPGPRTITTSPSRISSSRVVQNEEGPRLNGVSVEQQPSVKHADSKASPDERREPARGILSTPNTSRPVRKHQRVIARPRSPKIRSRHMVQVPSPTEGSPRLLGFSHCQRGERPKRKRQQKPASPPPQTSPSKPQITPFSWRSDVKLQKQKTVGSPQEAADHYSDDFDSENEEQEKKENKENKSPKQDVPVKRPVRRKPHRGPSTPPPPPPKVRHYSASIVQSYINKQKQQRANQSKETRKIEQIKTQQRENQLRALEIRAKRIVAASVRKHQQQAQEKPINVKEVVPNNTPRKEPKKPLTPTKSPGSSLSTSMKSTSFRLSDEFIDKFASLHESRPEHQLIMDEQIEKEGQEIKLKADEVAKASKLKAQQARDLALQQAKDVKSDRSEFSVQGNELMPQSSAPSVAAARSTARYIQHVISTVRADAAATKIQAVYRGYKIRQSSRKITRTKKPKLNPPVAIESKSEHILQTWVQKSDADPFNFIQSVKRKLSEATRTDATIQVVPSEVPIQEQQKHQTPVEDKYESDFESSVLSISPSEEIAIGTDSRASQHSLASITPDKNEEISALASHSPPISQPESPQSLVVPSVALVVPVDHSVVSRPFSGPEGRSADSKSSSSDSKLLSTATNTPVVTKYNSVSSLETAVSVSKPPTETLVVKSVSVPCDIADTVRLNEKQTQYSFQSPPSSHRSVTVSDRLQESRPVALSSSDASIKELEMSIEAGFGRLTEEINAVRRMFGLPCSEVDVPTHDSFKFSTPLPKLDLLTTGSKIAHPRLNELVFSNTLQSPILSHVSPPSYKTSEQESKPEQESKQESRAEQSSSPTLTESKMEGDGAVSEVTTSGGLPRVLGAARDLEESLVSAQSNLQQLVDQESLDDISEHVSEGYSSKFEEMESEEAGSAKSAAFSSTTQTASEVLTEVMGKESEAKVSPPETRTGVSSSDSQRQATSSTDQDSFTVFSLAMFQQLVRDQELRARHQRALLKQREDAIFEKSKAELFLLENQKKQLRSSGMEAMIPGIKKRQRAILMRLNQERDEIKRLRESHKMASQERRLMLQQQQHIAKMRLAARELSSKLQYKDLTLKSQRLLEAPRRPKLAPSEEESSAASLSLDTSDFSHSKASSGEEQENSTTASLKDVLHKLKKVEKNRRVLVTPIDKRDEVNSSEMVESENNSKKLTDAHSVPVISQQPSLRDCSTSPLPPTEEIFTETCTQGEVEEAITSQALSVPTTNLSDNIQDETRPSPILEVSSLEPKLYSNDSFETINTSMSVQESVSDKDKVVTAAGPLKPAPLRPPVTIKVPLSPRLQGKQKRRHSSGSDESIVLSQPETASEQSDVESRICALQEQLRRRKMEAERLRREQKRCHRERLRAKEQSLLKQIQAYDSYIQDARRELEQEFEAGVSSAGCVRPQIKQPRVAEKNLIRKTDVSEANSVSAEIKTSESARSVEQEESLQVKSSPVALTAQSEALSVSEASMVATDLSAKEEASESSIKEERTKDESINVTSEQDSKNVSLIIKEEDAVQFTEQNVNHISPDKVKEQDLLAEGIKLSQAIPMLVVDEKGDHELELPEASESMTSQDISEHIMSEMSEHIEVETAPVSAVLQDEHELKEEAHSPVKTEENLVTIDEKESPIETEEVPVKTEQPEKLEEHNLEAEEIITDAQSQESVSAETSVETTIESPRRGVDEVEAKKDESEEDISESLPDTSASSDELQEDEPREDREQEVARITEYLLQKLVTDNVAMSCEKLQSKKEHVSEEISKAADRIADILSQELLEEAIQQLWPIYMENKNKRVIEAPRTPSSSILERVQSLLAVAEISSPRDISRPQALMMTTYVEECLSPEPETQPEVQPDAEPGESELVASKDEIQDNEGEDAKVTPAPSSATPEVELSKETALGGDTGAAAAATKGGVEDEGEEGATSPAHQDWFDEDFGLSSTRREAEELRLQQLQIEQEIQQLQAQQYPYYYVREIPNKPPPPYTPPGETLKSPEEAAQTPGAVPSSQEQVLPLIARATETLYHARLAGRDLDTVQPSWEPEAEQDTEACQVYKHFLFDLSKQIVQEAYSCPEQDSPPWLEPPTVRRRKALLMPKTLQELQQRVEEQVMSLLGFSKRPRREKLIIRWSRKRRDHVDELLVREAQEEEQAWTNYELDEAAVKSQISDALLNMLLTDTASVVNKAIKSKESKLREN